MKQEKQYRVVANAAGHSYQIGSIVTATKLPNGYWKLPNGQNACHEDLAPYAYSRDDVNKEIEELKGALSLAEARLAYLDEIDEDELDMMEFKAWAALKALDSDASTAEKAKAIAKIIKG